MKIKKRTFGVFSSGKKVSLYTISNNSMSFSVTNYGCIITSIILLEKNGSSVDVALGYSTLEGYLVNKPHFGALIGRYAGRISKAEFALLGKKYDLEKNDGDNCLHSGYQGFHKRIWKSKPFITSQEAGVLFSLESPQGDQGFPGNLSLKISYSLTNTNDILIRYFAETDEPTPVNLTNHTYFNLSGHDAGTLDTHEFQLHADRYLEVDSSFIPTGKLSDVEKTDFDFRALKPLAKNCDSTTINYNHTWEVNRSCSDCDLAAHIVENTKKRSLTVYSNQAGMHFYTSQYLHAVGKDGFTYSASSAFCLESQGFPNAPNELSFPNTILLPQDTYQHHTKWHFDFESIDT